MRYRLNSVVVLFSIGLSLIGIGYFDNLWPVLPLSIAIGAVTLIFASYRLGPSAAWLLGACGLLFSHTSIALLYPETLSVIDPDTYAVWVNQVIESGSISQAENRTYSALPLFLLLISIVSEVTALAPRNAFVAIPVLVSTIVPLFAAWFTALLTGCRYSEWPAVPAALLSSILTMTVVSGYRPIAMTAGYLLMFIAFIASIRFFLWQNKADIVAFAVLGFGVVISHRFTILLLTLGVVGQGVVLTLKPPRRLLDYIALPAVAGIFLVLQWVYLTTSLSVAVSQLETIFANPGVHVGVAEVQTSASKPVIESRVFGILARRAHGLVLIPMAGLSWIYFSSIEYTHLRRGVLLALTTAAVLGAFLPLSVAFPDQLNYTRSVTVIEPVLIGLVVGGGWLVWRRVESRSETVVTGSRAALLFFGMLVITAQVSSAPISTDHPANYRGYLEYNEVTAKMWGHQYVEATISADPFFAHEKPLPQMHVDSNGEINQEYRQRYRRMLEPYTDRSLVNACPGAVMYRTIRVYRGPRAPVLQWDPEPTLNTEYSRQYDAGKVQLFGNPKCT